MVSAAARTRERWSRIISASACPIRADRSRLAQRRIRRRTAEMDELRGVREPRLPAPVVRTPTEIEVFRIHEARLRKSPEGVPHRAVDEHHRADRRLHLAGGRMAPVGAETRLPAVRDEPAETARPDKRRQLRRERSDARLQREVLVQEPRHRYRDRRPANCLDQ